MGEAAVDFCGLRVVSDEAIPELSCSKIDSPLALHLSRGSRQSEAPGPSIHEWVNDSGVMLSLGKRGSGYILKFGDGATFSFDSETRTVRYTKPLDSTARHQLLDQVLPRVLDHLGHLMIHGSAVNTKQGAVVFIGDSGAGKSTIAASFETAGAQLLSDDCLRLASLPEGDLVCSSTYRGLRLWPDSADSVMASAPFERMATNSEKGRVELSAGLVDQPYATVAAICVLADPDDEVEAVTVARVAPTRAVALLLAQCFRLDPTDAEATKRTFERCADVVERVPVVELSYPRQYDRLPEVREAVLQRAASGDWPTARAT